MCKKSTSSWKLEHLPKSWQLGHLVAIALALVLPASVAAVPVYNLSHQSDSFGNAGPSETVGPQGTPIDYSFSGVTYFTGANFGTVQANIDRGSIGITATAFNNGAFAPQRQEVSASFQFDVIFGSAGASPIDVMMNMMISGIVSPGNNNSSTVQVFAGRSYLGFHTGFYSENKDGMVDRSGLLSGFTDDGTKQLISTGLINVPVNVPVQMSLLFKTIQPYSTDTGTISFGNTLSLSTIGDVFTIVGAGGITVNSVDAGIVNNRFSVAAVPVPAALPLFGSALAMLGFFGWRRKRLAASA